ncbi:MAG TPA: adenosine deaminase [bacterium]|nr:adenosine deaminase [bacterium]
MLKDKTLDFIARMPKVELHLHLEGTIQPTTAIELMRRNCAKNAPRTVEELLKIYDFQDLSHFVRAMKIVSNHITRLEDLDRVCSEMLEECARQNTRYLEFDCALQKYIDLGMPLSDVVAVLDRAVQAAEVRYGILARMVVNLQRSHGDEKTANLVKEIARLNHPLIVGVGLSGDETQYPQKEFINTFAIAREAGLRRTVHAGEALGSQSVWDALELLHAQRIDHGTRAIEDERLVRHLVDAQIPLTQCLTSNLRLNVVSAVKRHPFALFFHSGVLVTLNTDDPQIFQTSLTGEYELAYRAFGFSEQELQRIAHNGIKASFLPEEARGHMLQRMEPIALADCEKN